VSGAADKPGVREFAQRLSLDDLLVMDHDRGRVQRRIREVVGHDDGFEVDYRYGDTVYFGTSPELGSVELYYSPRSGRFTALFRK
jgi:hypothetical protein